MKACETSVKGESTRETGAVMATVEDGCFKRFATTRRKRTFYSATSFMSRKSCSITLMRTDSEVMWCSANTSIRLSKGYAHGKTESTSGLRRRLFPRVLFLHPSIRSNRKKYEFEDSPNDIKTGKAYLHPREAKQDVLNKPSYPPLAVKQIIRLNITFLPNFHCRLMKRRLSNCRTSTGNC